MVTTTASSQPGPGVANTLDGRMTLVTTAERPGDCASLIGMEPNRAVLVASEAGVEDIRVLEMVDGVLVGPMDMSLRSNARIREQGTDS
jgi:hypothetical protein